MIANGRLFWVLDAYTLTGQYPYSTRTEGGFNYIRNSVKAVVDAYHGTTTFYLSEPSDPIAVTVGKIFPGLLRPMAEMPESLRRHVRYPEGIFGVQSAMYATYHMTNPAVFYNKEDQWEVPSIESGRASLPIAVLHHHAPAAGAGRRVRADAPVHAAAQGQPGTAEPLLPPPGRSRKK